MKNKEIISLLIKCIIVPIIFILFLLYLINLKHADKQKVVNEESNSKECQSLETRIEDTKDENEYEEIIYSMDFSDTDTFYLLKIATYMGGSVEDRVNTMLITINRARDSNYPSSIKAVVLDELYGNRNISAYDFESITSDNMSKEALDIVSRGDVENGGLLSY